MIISKIIFFALAFTTFLTLVIGIVAMSIGNKFDKKYSNKLMTLRVVLQFMTIVFVALYVYLKNKA